MTLSVIFAGVLATNSANNRISAEMNTSDEQAFLEMIEANKNLIYKVCLTYKEDHESIADTYQDIVLNLWTSYPKFRGESKTSTWIYRIALNTCISEVRKRQARPETVPMTYEMEDLLGNDNSQMQQIRELYSLINRLGKLERAIILLWLDDKSYDEIGQVLGLSKTNVGVRLTRIKEKLKTLKNN